jgi:hypothetical protein
MAYVYDPREVKVAWGEISITGFASESFLSVEFNSPQWSTTVGLDGVSAFSPKYNFSGTCTFRLMQGSTGNQLLAGLIKAQEESLSSELLQNNLTITDSSGAFNLRLQNAIVVSQPPVSYAVQASEGTREWVFYSPSIVYKGEVDTLRDSSGPTGGELSVDVSGNKAGVPLQELTVDVSDAGRSRSSLSRLLGSIF